MVGQDYCPASEFLDSLDVQTRQRFEGQLDAITKDGIRYCNPQRFRDLRGVGRPLWEFIEKRCRLYASRRIVDKMLVVVLFNGLLLGKEKNAPVIAEEIIKAKRLLEEFENEKREKHS